MTKPKWQRRCNTKSYCTTLTERMIDAGLRGGSGIVLHRYINIRTRMWTRSLVVHKLKAKDPGLVLNHCPWCGYDFSKRKDWPKPHELEDVKKPRKKQNPDS